jgi:hypothetical protein
MVAVGPGAAYKGPMSEPAGPTPVVTQTPHSGGTEPPATGPVGPPAVQPKPTKGPKPKGRQARVVIRKLGPWSVLKISVLFYLCVMAVIVGAFVILYAVLDAIGALDSVTRLIRDLFADQTFEIHADWLLSRGVLIGLAMVVLWSLINLFVVFLYNLLSDIVGGVEVTLSERR